MCVVCARAQNSLKPKLLNSTRITRQCNMLFLATRLCVQFQNFEAISSDNCEIEIINCWKSVELKSDSVDQGFELGQFATPFSFEFNCVLLPYSSILILSKLYDSAGFFLCISIELQPGFCCCHVITSLCNMKSFDFQGIPNTYIT